MEIKITKKELLKEVNNEMCHNFYYLVHGRIYNEAKTQYKPFKFVVWFDVFDMQEYFEQDFYTKENVKEYVSEIASGYFYEIKSYEDCQEFFNLCNKMIEEYNRIR